MYGQTHHLRGRLRLRFSQLKNHSEQLSAVTASLRRIAGIHTVEDSPYTGGILIHYDSASGDTRRFWDDIAATLEAHGLHHDPRPLARRSMPAAPANTGSGAGGALVAAVGGVVVDKLVERCALALFAALL